LEGCAVRAVCESVGLAVPPSPLTPFGAVKHAVANRRITLHGFEVSVAGDAAPQALACARWAWVTRESLAGYALATPQVRLTDLLWRHESQGRLEF
jgi:ADP-ribose pyrophosphatase YjhB (NUDIX family)